MQWVPYTDFIEYLIKYEYDSKGQVIKETKYSFDEPSGFEFDSEIEYEYDLDGNIIRELENTNFGSSYEYYYEYSN